MIFLKKYRKGSNESELGKFHSVDEATRFRKKHYLHTVPQKDNRYIILSSDFSSKFYFISVIRLIHYIIIITR